ncbi:MAG: hypothetical protein KatS3mg111_0150 [Pirellulaceae bacterium]|nr:MAG: hypothetical protein KatS3mg111_0150 [Pirellulaceae bacterium]
MKQACPTSPLFSFALVPCLLLLTGLWLHAEEPHTASLQEGIPWLDSAAKAAELSMAHRRPILVYVRSARCGYCDLLQKNVWEDRRVGAWVRTNFIPLKLTREAHREHLEVLQVRAFPTILVFSPDLKYLTRIDGYVDADGFLTRMARVVPGALEVADGDRQLQRR